MKKIGAFLLGLVLGGLVGGAVTILLAPSSGKLTRQQISDYSQKVTDEVRVAAQQKRIELEQQLNKLRKPALPLE
jgi:gas vesicle protein